MSYGRAGNSLWIAGISRLMLLNPASRMRRECRRLCRGNKCRFEFRYPKLFFPCVCRIREYSGHGFPVDRSARSRGRFPGRTGWPGRSGVEKYRTPPQHFHSCAPAASDILNQRASCVGDRIGRSETYVRKRTLDAQKPQLKKISCLAPRLRYNRFPELRYP